MTELIIYNENPYGGLFTKYEKYISISTNADEFLGTPYYFVKNTKENFHPIPEKENTYLIFALRDRYIIPTSYILEGRTYCDSNQLINWELYGRTMSGNWELLDEKQGHTLKYQTVEHFNIEASKRNKYNAFKLQMKGRDSSGLFYLCIGSINVYGSIARNYCIFPLTLKRKRFVSLPGILILQLSY